ncbi:MAG: acyl-CoA dehydrogenase [Salinibacterium sp.]|nr:acyl-CoA dehydrogenase family protein [Salinibacterium sp.]MBF0673351.1 acyl-CoA dehydrogenase [Salinibacterium sp.]
MVRERIEGEGGVDVLRRCVADPDVRGAVGDMLGELGIWEIDISEGPIELEVAAEVCRAAGRYALPYPVVERLGATGADATALVSARGQAIANHRDLDLTWNALDLEGSRYDLPSGRRLPSATKLAPFGSEVDPVPRGDKAVRGAARLVLLQGWWLLGLLENAIEDTARYTEEREQFGRKLVRFQSVAFQLADMVLESEGSSELAKYALWSITNSADDDDALAEALGLRVALQRAAGVVLRGAHQLHGAMGFTDEVDVSWLSRASQAVRRLPEDSQRTTGAFLSAVERAGYSELGHIATASR